MAAAGELKLKHYYQQELRGLREQAAEFARDHPAVAQELALSRGRSADPHVELLMQSFAFLAGRLQYQLDAEQSTLPNALLGHLYPHLEGPIPCMAVAQVDVKVDGANFANGWTLERHRRVFAVARNEGGRGVKCRLRACYDTPLWPLDVKDIGLTPTNHYEFLGRFPEVHSVLKVKVKSVGPDPIQDMPLTSLRFHLHGDDTSAYALYDLLSVHLTGVAVRMPNQDAPQILPAGALRWMGYEDDEAALTSNNATHSGYRIIQEYFAFPEKFMFFEVSGIDPTGAIDELELLFLLDTAPDRSIKTRRDTLRLNCVPLVNLFPQPIDPLRLNHRSHEYQLIADQENHKYCEIYSIDALSAIRADASPRPLAPYFSLGSHESLEADDYFYATRRAESQFRSVPGTELYISFLDLNFDPFSNFDLFSILFT